MSGGFWPTLPLKIPYSEGVPHWWDPAWWIFQIVVMTILLLTLRRVALSVDKSDKAAKTSASGRRPGASSDQPPSIPG
ncbi:MAG: hypothetical protein C7B44_00960 [Sulfobacillus thermosulfidooxidans]|uniref:Uncharacterized protein n=1 Tax=Sulfobacillus thermotolerans TaxID=338644 RepID=A0ABM6RPW5_9FIRM|nr:hypothetical protein BXT84_04630 [Sulfobacillus thermotolerans]AUW95166.1 hypothetical protein BXT84_15370 [Sulfobacillus thermotolerans]MCY0908630.1 hypothetical protein [Sulfobacillus thermotolerans]PSR37949.1 MAG: hypothetical protein C7B44_00960 [Sulfobacillus thermosulfidooxidans]